MQTSNLGYLNQATGYPIRLNSICLIVNATKTSFNESDPLIKKSATCMYKIKNDYSLCCKIYLLSHWSDVPIHYFVIRVPFFTRCGLCRRANVKQIWTAGQMNMNSYEVYIWTSLHLYVCVELLVSPGHLNLSWKSKACVWSTWRNNCILWADLKPSSTKYLGVKVLQWFLR